VLTVVLGALLGAENLNAPEASGWLRVPALIAALILVAQGLLDFDNERRLHDEAKARAKAERAERARVERERAAAEAEQQEVPARLTLTTVPAPTPMVRDKAALVDQPSSAESTTVTNAPDDDAVAQAQEQAASERTVTTVRESGGAVLAILLLAVWLGLATLSYSTAPASLLGLSLIASFLLFASAWSMLQGRRA
jgi:hypothetical protein